MSAQAALRTPNSKLRSQPKPDEQTNKQTNRHEREEFSLRNLRRRRRGGCWIGGVAVK